MKRFTIKDFIGFNNPCFNCGNNISIEVGVTHSDITRQDTYLRPTISTPCTEVDLRISYNSSLKLVIDHKTNQFMVNSIGALTNYFDNHKLFLESKCNRCQTFLRTQYLEFDLEKGFVRPIGLSREILHVSDDANLYVIASSYIEDRSHVVVDRIDKTTPLSPIRFDAPLLALRRFKNKEHLISKLKIYVIFS